MEKTQQEKKAYCKEWYKKNKNKHKNNTRLYKLVPENKARKNQLFKERWQTDITYRLSLLASNAIRRVFKNKGDGGWKRLTGYTGEELIEHFEQLFDSKMNWSNYGTYWQVDHIKARALFRYDSTEDKEFKECWALKNLRPLEAIKNLSTQPSL